MSDEFDVSGEDYDEYDEEADEGFEDGDDFDSSEDSEEPDPYAWAQGIDPKAIEKTWTQYTQTREEVLRDKAEAERMRRELEPLQKLKDDIYADPNLVELIDGYYREGRAPEREILDVKREVQTLKNQMATEREMNSVLDWAQSEGYPEVDERAILQHAIDNGIGNLKSAYKDMMFEQIQNVKADRLAEDIKTSRGAKSPTSRKPNGASASVSRQDIYDMSDEDFIKNYEKVLARYQ